MMTKTNASFLLELLVEELPASMQRRMTEMLANGLVKKLQENGLTTSQQQVFYTPRRMAVLLKDVPCRQQDSILEIKGPKCTAPDQAIQGFLRANNLQSCNDLQRRNDGKNDIWFAIIEKAGKQTKDILPPLICEVIGGLNWPKSMRFAMQNFTFGRPLRNIMAIFDGGLIAGDLSLGNDEILSFKNYTYGHRFMHPEKITLTDADEYEEKLIMAKVIVDADKRKASILSQIEEQAKKANTQLPEESDKLLNEVNGLIEYPVVLIGRIDEKFMGLPQEILMTSMRVHQKYFPLLNRDKGLAPLFAFVSNIEAKDNGKAIINGNERVLRARLQDALFFWQKDKECPLMKHADGLKGMLFYKNLGSVHDKIMRMEQLAYHLNAEFPTHLKLHDASKIATAVHLAKADLTTNMVGEFPELQGIMGGYYARDENIDDDIVLAIQEHYSPEGPSDYCPKNTLSILVALSDKLDTLAGFWAVGEKPTGSKDPFALRRAAIGVLRLIDENNLRLSLDIIIQHALQNYMRLFTRANDKDDIASPPPDRDEVRENLKEFLMQRFANIMRDKSIPHDVMAAVLSADKKDDIVYLQNKINFIAELKNAPPYQQMFATSKRLFNILKDVNDDLSAMKIDKKLFLDASEGNLFDILQQEMPAYQRYCKGEDWGQAIDILQTFADPVDKFFQNVMVNDKNEKVRHNRLKLLHEIKNMILQIADFSQLENI